MTPTISGNLPDPGGCIVATGSRQRTGPQALDNSTVTGDSLYLGQTMYLPSSCAAPKTSHIGQQSS